MSGSLAIQQEATSELAGARASTATRSGWRKRLTDQRIRLTRASSWRELIPSLR